MFIDQITLNLIAGSGGDGAVSWRREKYIPKGGPAGGDGGDGGSITIEASTGIFSLENYRNRRIIRAKNGMPGGSAQKKGKKGENLVIKVPIGTLIKDSETKEVLFDLVEHGQKAILCEAGKGGKGNINFATPTNRAPTKFTKGTSGEVKNIELELKLIADVGLVGMPNAGKSTLINALAKIPVKIAPYPFTTLIPNLGIVEFDDFSRVMIADIPGIIKDAHQDKGLGLYFLKHIERTTVLVYVIDISSQDQRDPLEDFLLLEKELKLHNPDLLKKSFLVALNQIDRLEDSSFIQEFKNKYPYSPDTLFEISALKKEGLSSFMEKVHSLIPKEILFSKR